MINAAWATLEALAERWPLTSPGGQDTRTDGIAGAGGQGGRRQEWDMTAMFCFFLLAMPQVILDPSSPTRDGTLALCS